MQLGQMPPGHSDAGLKQSTGRGLPGGMSRLAGDAGVPTPASFAAGCVQAAEAAGQNAQAWPRQNELANNLNLKSYYITIFRCIIRFLINIYLIITYKTTALK